MGLYVVDRVKKGKVLPYLLLSVGPVADPGVQAVSPQVTLSHPPGGRLPSLSARPAVTFPAKERHSPSAGTKLYCLARVSVELRHMFPVGACFRADCRDGF